MKTLDQMKSDLLRCIFRCPAMPREMVECDVCKGYWKKSECSNCINGKVVEPLIDPRWKSSTVLDLAKVIRGFPDLVEKRERLRNSGRGVLCNSGCCYECVECSAKTGSPDLCKECLELRAICNSMSESAGVFSIDPQPIHPILADALEDAGCDNEFIISHLRQEVHVAGKCWVVEEILK